MKSNIFSIRMCLLALGCLIPFSASVEAASGAEAQDGLTAFVLEQPSEATPVVSLVTTSTEGKANAVSTNVTASTTSTATATATSAVKKPAEIKYPMKIEADSMYYSNKSGEVRAEGNVIAKQGPQTLTTELLHGNQKENLYYMPGSGRLRDGALDMTGNVASYNSVDQHMTMQDGEGLMRPYYVRGKEIDYNQGVGRMRHGMLTTEHAMAWENPPDYRVEAEDIVMVPGDYLTMKEAKFFIRNWHIMTLSSYTTSLKRNQSANLFSFMPRPNYSSDNGFGLRGRVVFPTGKHGETYFNYDWYTKVGFKPDIGYRHYFPWGGASIGYKKEESTINDRNVWIEKKPELNVWTNRYSIGNTPFYVSFNGSMGEWVQGERKGSHRMIHGVITHKPIYLGSDVSFNASLGYKKDWYEYRDTIRSMPYWKARINWRVNNRMNLWISYSQFNFDHNSPYTFDREDYRKRTDFGGYWRIDRMNAVGFKWTRNEVTNKITEKNLYYYRDFHSFGVNIRYRIDTKAWEMKWVLKDF